MFITQLKWLFLWSMSQTLWATYWFLIPPQEIYQHYCGGFFTLLSLLGSASGGNGVFCWWQSSWHGHEGDRRAVCYPNQVWVDVSTPIVIIGSWYFMNFILIFFLRKILVVKSWGESHLSSKTERRCWFKSKLGTMFYPGFIGSLVTK